jgi:hypothetical protein
MCNVSEHAQMVLETGEIVLSVDTGDGVAHKAAELILWLGRLQSAAADEKSIDGVLCCLEVAQGLATDISRRLYEQSHGIARMLNQRQTQAATPPA